MIDIDNGYNAIANPDQAAILHGWALHATNDGKAKLEVAVTDLPAEIMTHFPEPRPEADVVEHLIRPEIERTPHPRRLPKVVGALANVYFLQIETVGHEEPDEEIAYVTRAGYHIQTDPGGILEWRFFLTNAEHSQRTRRLAAEGINRILNSKKPVDLRGLSERKAQEEAKAKELGLSLVYEKEADAVIAFCRTVI